MERSRRMQVTALVKPWRDIKMYQVTEIVSIKLSIYIHSNHDQTELRGFLINCEV